MSGFLARLVHSSRSAAPTLRPRVGSLFFAAAAATAEAAGPGWLRARMAPAPERDLRELPGARRAESRGRGTSRRESL